MIEFIYPGFMSKEAQEFFKENMIKEQRDGCAVMGFFITLEDGRTILPSKGDKFIKNEQGKLTLVYGR